MINDKRGVSPVVGTILLIAVTVALAAVIATIVGRIGVPAKAPYAILGVTAKKTDSENVKLTIIHRGGDTLVTSELKVNAEKKDNVLVDITDNIGWGDDLFSPGQEASGTYWYGEDAAGKIIKIKIIHKPSGQLLLDTSVRVE